MEEICIIARAARCDVATRQTLLRIRCEALKCACRNERNEKQHAKKQRRDDDRDRRANPMRFEFGSRKA